jgi:hypothetical protein
MGDAGVELGLVFVQPGFQHRQQSGTNDLVRQDKHNAAKEETITEQEGLDNSLPWTREV